jgi:hypothetical protein
MFIGQGNFPILSMQQANPMLWGLQQGNQLTDQVMKNLMTAQQLPFVGPMSQAKLQEEQANAQYAQPNALLDLAGKAIGLPYTPYKYMSPMIGNMARWIGAGNNTQNSLSRWLQETPAGQSYSQTPEGKQLIQSMNTGATGQANLLQNGLTNGSTNAAGMSMPQQLDISGAMKMLNNMGVDTSSLNGLMGGNDQQQSSATGNYAVFPGVKPSSQGVPVSSDQVQKLQQLMGVNGAQATDNAGSTNTNSQASDQQIAISKKSMKDTTDQQARQKSLNSSNIDKTFAQIDPNVLTQYSGPQGEIQKAMDYKASFTDPNSAAAKRYLNYAKAQTAAETLAGQIRQFYGDSVQPSRLQELQSMANPGGISVPPEVAKAKFNQLKNILNNETGTYRDALQGTDVYKSPAQTPLVKNFTQDDLAHTAQKYGMTVDQVKQKLGIQ